MSSQRIVLTTRIVEELTGIYIYLYIKITFILEKLKFCIFVKLDKVFIGLQYIGINRKKYIVFLFP